MPPDEVREKVTSAELTEIMAHDRTHLSMDWYIMARGTSALINAFCQAKTSPLDLIPKLRPDPDMDEAQMRANMATYR